MSNPRLTGLLLLLTGVLTLVGNTMDILPPQSFWAGLLTYPIGGYLFFMGSRQSFANAEQRTARALNPRIKNAQGEAFARQQERHIVNPHASGSDVQVSIEGFDDEPSAWTAGTPAEATTSQQVPRREVVLHDDEVSAEEEFSVASDVSFPNEGSEPMSIADQLEKLSKLQQQGVISAEELAIAKAKLLR